MTWFSDKNSTFDSYLVNYAGKSQKGVKKGPLKAWIFQSQVSEIISLLVNLFKCIFLNENVWISIKISLKFVPRGPINNIPSLVQIMAWRRPGDKPLAEPMMVSLPMHICITPPQWVNQFSINWQNCVMCNRTGKITLIPWNKHIILQ